MELRGKVILKVTGILLMIGGVLNILVGVLSFFGGGATAIYGSRTGVATPDQAAAIGGLMLVYAVICLVYGIVALLAGLCGFRHADEIRYAGTCVKYGIALIAIDVINAVLVFFMNNFTLSVVTGFILPILYLVGAYMNKRS